ncbi:hypothetical protein [Pontibacter brevis]
MEIFRCRVSGSALAQKNSQRDAGRRGLSAQRAQEDKMEKAANESLGKQ